MNPEYKDNVATQIAGNFTRLEDRVMYDIVRRIKKTGEITSTADYQINRLLAQGYSSDAIEGAIKEALDATYPEMEELYDNVANWEYVRNKKVYEQLDKKFISYEENKQIQKFIQSVKEQTKEELKNITRSLGFYTTVNGKKELLSMGKTYQHFLDQAIMDIATGPFDYGSVLRRTVTQLANSGLRTIDYESGIATRIDVAARRAVMTGMSQITGKITDDNAKKLGTDYFEVAWHPGARPSHQTWQGRVFKRQDLYDVCGLGTVTGLLGANCYHEYYPFFPGISERNWTDDWLERANKYENTPKKFKGKKYTFYEAKQRQRQLETAMRAQRQKVRLLEKGEGNADDILIAKCKYQNQLNEYVLFSKHMGLKQERARIYLDMKGRVAPSNKGYAKYLSKIEEARICGIIEREIKEAGIKGKAKFDFEKVDISDYTFDDMHINKERAHNITRDNAKMLISESDFVLERWNGRFINYYGPRGAVYVDIQQKNIRTAFWSDEYDGNTKEIRRILKKYGK